MYKQNIIKVIFIIIVITNIKAYSQEVFPNKPIIHNGFYLHLGIGFPARTYLGYTSSMGPQINLEIGHQYYFYKTDKSGAGIKISWIQIGYGANRGDLGYGNLSTLPYRIHTFDMRLLKFGPQYTVAFTNRVALDLSLDISPTAMYAVGTTYGNNTSFRYLGFFVGLNLRLRYKKVAFGAEVAFGKLTSKDLEKNTNPYEMSYKANYIYPRIYMGFQF